MQRVRPGAGRSLLEQVPEQKRGFVLAPLDAPFRMASHSASQRLACLISLAENQRLRAAGLW